MGNRSDYVQNQWDRAYRSEIRGDNPRETKDEFDRLNRAFVHAGRTGAGRGTTPASAYKRKSRR